MRSLHSNQQKILEFLLNRPEGATIEELCSHLEITKTATKEHLLKLEGHGYIGFIDQRGAVGRPKRRYNLTNSGQDVFPKQYSWLSTILLEHLAEQMGPENISQTLTSLAQKVAGSMGDRFKHADKTELLSKVTQVMNELGYRASLKQSDLRKGAVIEATNCVYHNVAKQHPSLCQFDVQFLKSVSGMDIRLETCIARGDSVCRFCLKKK